MSRTLTANEVKTKGVSAFRGTETFITVRGEKKYVVFPIERFNQIREQELAIALAESEADLLAGRFHEDTIEDHLKRISA